MHLDCRCNVFVVRRAQWQDRHFPPTGSDQLARWVYPAWLWRPMEPNLNRAISVREAHFGEKNLLRYTLVECSLTLNQANDVFSKPSFSVQNSAKDSIVNRCVYPFPNTHTR